MQALLLFIAGSMAAADSGSELTVPVGGFLGVRVEEYKPGEDGMLIQAVVPGSAAAKAGLLPQDVIVKINHHGIREVQDFITRVSSHRPGERLRLQVLRDGKLVPFAIPLGERPADLE